MNKTAAESNGHRVRLYVWKQIKRHDHPAFGESEYAAAEDCVLLVVTGGSGKLVAGGAGFQLEKGKCVLLAPSEEAALRAGDSGLGLYRLTFAAWEAGGGASPGLTASEPICRGVLQCQPFSQCLEYVEAIYRLRDAAEETEQFDRQVCFLELLRFLFRQNAEAGAATTVRRAVEQSIALIGSSYWQGWTVDQLASAAHVNRWHYTRVFKELTGQIPLDYLNAIRIDRAKQLLRQTNDRLYDISQQVGFSNEYYFSRRFKQTVGISPGQYRRNHGEDREGIRVFAPFLEDFLVALGITPVLQCAHSLWGKQDYLGLEQVPQFNLAADPLDAVVGLEPDLIILDDGMEKWLEREQIRRLAPTFSLSNRGEDWRMTLCTLADLLDRRERVPDVIARYERKASEARAALGCSLYAGPEQGYTGPVLYKDLGLEPHPLVRQLTGGAREAYMTLEWLARLDADHLFVTFDKRHSASAGEERAVLESAEWRLLPAVRSGCVYEVDFLTSCVRSPLPQRSRWGMNDAFHEPPHGNRLGICFSKTTQIRTYVWYNEFICHKLEVRAMIRGQIVHFRAYKRNVDRLFACNRASAQVWNACLQAAKEYHAEHQKWISKSELQKRTKGKFHLHSQSIQAVCHKYLFARDAAHQSIRKGIRTARPYKIKKHYNTKWAKDGFKLFDNGKIELSMGIHEGKREAPIVVYAAQLPAGHIKEIELGFDQGLYLAITYEDGVENQPYHPNQAAGVDPGEIHTLTAFREDGESLMVTGRKVRSIHRLRNKKLAELQRLQSRCKKGSRQWKKYGKVKRFILSKSKRQLRDALHKTTRQFVNWCMQQSVSDVYLGDVEGVQRNSRKKKRVGCQQAQKLSNWSMGKVKAYVKYKLDQQGIRLHTVDESYTSQTCPVCQKRNKCTTRYYRCACGYVEHRDIHGARNILSKALYEEIRPIEAPTKVKYLRIA